MYSNFKVNNPDMVTFELTVGMSLHEWKLLKGQFDQMHRNSSPAWELRSQIDNMIEQAEEKFYPSKENSST